MKPSTTFVALLALFCLTTHSRAQERIRVGLGSISLQSGLVHIAKDRGLFAKYGLFAESVYIPGGSTMKRLGVDPVKEATILQIGDEPARIAAVTSGNVDGTVVNAPFGSEAERLKLNVIADSVKMNIPFFNTGMLGSKRYMDKQDAKVMNFLRAYLEAIKILKTEREYSIKALAQFTRVSNLKAIAEGLDYFNNQLQPVPYPSVDAMQAVVAQLAESNPKARGVDAKVYVNDRYLKRLEDEGFVKKIWGK